MSVLFQNSAMNGMVLKNRFVRSATWTGMADERGACTQRLIEFYADLARGGVGLIITGHAYVRKDGQAGPRQLGIDREELIPALKRLTNSVHDSGSRIVLQISHAGGYAIETLTGSLPLVVSGGNPYMPQSGKELNVSDIADIVDAYARAAERAKEAGFDGVQIHAAHGYLLNQFLSPAYNQRTDRYGAYLHQRAEALLAVVRRVRMAVGGEFPVLVKLNSCDYLDDGLDVSESCEIACLLEEAGVDAIEISGGTRATCSKTRVLLEADDAYFLPAAQMIRRKLRIPLILVGGIRSYETALRLVDEGSVDYVAMSRPFICEPHIVARWEKGDLRKSLCRSDNTCRSIGLNHGEVGCQMTEMLDAAAAIRLQVRKEAERLSVRAFKGGDA